MNSPAQSAEPLAVVAAQARQVQQYLRFSLDQQPHALRIDAVREILEVGHMTSLPLMPDFVRGVINLRGAVVPVIDLSARIGLGPATLGARTCMVVVDLRGRDSGASTQAMGVLVDAVHEVFDDGGRDMEPVPRLGTRVPARFIRGMVRVREQPVPELDLQSILDQNSLSELIADHTTAAV